jgi:hypothetical protein
MRPWRRKTLEQDSGQAMTEAAIGLSLMAFVWVMVVFITWMGGNHIRTAMATRHAAWMAGNGNSPTTANIAPSFFYEEGPCSVETTDIVDTSDLLGGGAFADIVGTILDSLGGQRFRYKVSYGIGEADVATTTIYPFNLMGAVFPFVGDTKIGSYLKVETSCQWEDVNETWDSALDVIKSILGL